MLKVIKPGVYASIQDGGRKHFRAFGVPVSGAMDPYAFQMGNHLLGNDYNAAAIEIFYGGIEFEITEDISIAITGANLRPLVDGEHVTMWKPIHLKEGQRLSFQGSTAGSITYVAIPGGVDSPVYLGSQSVYIRAGFGELIKKGDHIYSKNRHATRLRKLQPRQIPTYTTTIEVNVIPSHQESLFTPQSIDNFYNQSYKLAMKDRMGAKLEGEQTLELNQAKDIISEAVTFGTIQVPGRGQPMILMADSQTTGGYPTMGTIITRDLWRIAQIPPNGQIKFNRIKYST